MNITVLLNSNSQDPIPPANCASKIQQWIDTYTPGGDELILCDVDADGNNKGDTIELFQHVLYCYYWNGPNCLLWDRCSGVPMNFYFDEGLFMYKFYCGRPSKANARQPILDKLPAERCE